MKEKLKQLSSSSPSPAQCNLFVHVKLLGCMQNTLTKIISTTQNMERIKHRHSFLLQFTLLCFHTTARGEWWIPCPNEFMQNKACDSLFSTGIGFLSWGTLLYYIVLQRRLHSQQFYPNWIFSLFWQFIVHTVGFIRILHEYFLCCSMLLIIRFSVFVAIKSNKMLLSILA